MSCIHCGKNPYVSAKAQTLAEAKEITFTSDGEMLTAKAKPYNDAFYEIVQGKYKGNLVHTFNIIKK